MRERSCISGWPVLLGLAIVSAPGILRAQPADGRRLASRPARPAATTKPSLARGSAIIEPSQGRPVFAAPGDDLYFAMQLPQDFRDNIYITLVHHLVPGERRNLDKRTHPQIFGAGMTIVMKVPDDIRPGLYDLEVSDETTTVRQPCSVRIVERFKKRFRIVHLSDMDIGDLTAPRFEQRLPEEVNLLAPEFILATGNYTRWARVRNRPESWKGVKEFFAKFDAPVFMLCGQNDHEDSFSRLVAPNKIGALDYGDYHGLLLLDHAAHPVEQDTDQLQWIATDQLAGHSDAVFNFIVSNSPTLGLIRHWRREGRLDGLVKRHRLRLFVTGGHRDPDAAALRDIVGDSELHVVQTHQASSARLGGASGTAHYRIIEVAGDKISSAYPAEGDTGRVDSIPVGGLRVLYDGPNDGSKGRVSATVYNGLNRAFDNCRVTFCLARSGVDRSRSSSVLEPKLTIVGGELESTIVADDRVFAFVRVDLPDKSARKVLVTDGSWVPPSPAIAISYEGPTELVFRKRSVTQSAQPAAGYASAAEAAIILKNTGQGRLSVWPVIRLNGEEIAPRLAAGAAWPPSVSPGEPAKLLLDLKLHAFSPGPHTLQVFLIDDPLVRLTTVDLTLVAGD